MKLKTHRGARKRFKLTAGGKILRGHSAKKVTTVSPAGIASIKQMLPYG